MWHKSNAFGPANSRAKDCGRDIKRAVAIWNKVAVVPTVVALGNDFHAACPGESGRHETDRATGARHAEWREIYYLIRGDAANLTLFKLIGRIASYKEHIVRSKGDASIVVLANRRSCARIQCSVAGKTSDMPVPVAGDCDLIDAADRAVRCAANEQRIRIVILECKTTVGAWHSRQRAEVEERVVRIERRSDRGNVVPSGLVGSSSITPIVLPFTGALLKPALPMHERTRPHRERATDGHRCEEQSGREFFKVWFHRCFPFGFWFSLSGNVCRSPSVPGNSGRSSRKFSRGLNFLAADCADAADREELQRVRFACPQRDIWTALGLFGARCTVQSPRRPKARFLIDLFSTSTRTQRCLQLDR